MIRISFLVTTYDLEDWLLIRCIGSILSQPLAATEYEVIVIDDGSQVSAEKVIGQFTHPAIRFFRQANGGPGSARNTAIGMARGEYLYFVDGDDFLLPDSFSAVLPLLGQQPDILAVSFRKSGNKEIPELPATGHTVRHYPSGCDYMRTNHLTGCNWLFIFRNELIDKYGLAFRPRIVHEDEEFFTRLFFHAGKTIITDIPVYGYYIRQDSITHHPDTARERKRIDDFLFVIDSLKTFREEHRPEAGAERIDAISHKIDFLALDLILKIARSSDPDTFFDTYEPRMRDMQIFPLARRTGSPVYNLFRILSAYKPGRTLIRIADRCRTKPF